VAGDHGRTGGSLLVVGEPLVGEPFTATPLDFEFPIPASCQASESELRDYDILSVSYRNGAPDQLAAVLRNEPHFDGSGDAAYAFTSVQGCKEPDVPDVHRASFRPL
jgi:hypothetical protein